MCAAKLPIGNRAKAWRALYIAGSLVLLAMIVTTILWWTAPREPRRETMTVGEKTIRVEMARTRAQRNTGLMYRMSLPPDCGMLFIYSKERELAFWMENTMVPLSIAFIKADGRIAQIEQMKPLSRERTVARESVKYALEMNQGWFERNGITVGSYLETNDIPRK